MPYDSYAALTTADMKFPSITLASGERVTLTYGQYRALLETNRNQEDRATAYRAFHQAYADSQNTYAALYNGVLQRDWFHARARGYATTLDAALHGNNIPTSVVENLIASTKAGVEPLRRYHRLRRRVLGLETLPAVRRLRAARRARRAVSLRRGRRLDRRFGGAARRATISSTCARRSTAAGSTSSRTPASAAAPTRRRCTASHPYMLLNYNETLDAVFTLAHEMGHSMHTLLSHQAQPFVYAGYTIFVAEVPSTLSEALFLDLMLERAPQPRASASCCCSTPSTASPARSTRR